LNKLFGFHLPLERHQPSANRRRNTKRCRALMRGGGRLLR
jgi:hypothetical protein